MVKKTLVGIGFFLLIFSILVFFRQLSVQTFYLFDAVVMFFLAVGSYELVTSFEKVDYKAIKSIIITAVLLIYPVFRFLGMEGVCAFIFILVMVAGIMMTFNTKIRVKDLLATVFILIYPILIMTIFSRINQLAGLWGMMYILFLAICADSFAQWFGMTFKGPKLCPRISPKKTISGFVGGYFGGIVASVVIFLLFEYFKVFANVKNVYYTGLFDTPWKAIPVYAILAILGPTLSQLGDLFASWMKRQMGIKDFGNILPGHGGLMDRADSIIYVTAIFYLIVIVLTKNSLLGLTIVQLP